MKERERQSMFKDVSTERTAWDAHETIGENESLLFNFDHIKMRRKTARHMVKISKRIAPVVRNYCLPALLADQNASDHPGHTRRKSGHQTSEERQ